MGPDGSFSNSEDPDNESYRQAVHTLKSYFFNL
jgi:hypothetical protein